MPVDIFMNDRMEQFKLQISGWTNELEKLDHCDVQAEIDQLNGDIRSTVTAIGQCEHEQSLINERKQRLQRGVEGQFVCSMRSKVGWFAASSPRLVVCNKVSKVSLFATRGQRTICHGRSKVKECVQQGVKGQFYGGASLTSPHSSCYHLRVPNFPL